MVYGVGPPTWKPSRGPIVYLHCVEGGRGTFTLQVSLQSVWEVLMVTTDKCDVGSFIQEGASDTLRSFQVTERINNNVDLEFKEPREIHF